MAQTIDPEIIDEAGLTAWLDATLPAMGDGPLSAEVLTGGATNIVLRIDRGGPPAVLRRPPKVPRPDSARVLGREARILGALTGSGVPCPALHAACEDPAVIGAPFYVMDYVPGWLAMDPQTRPPAFHDPAVRRELATELVGGIARLATVDYRAIGLEGFGKPEGFLARQVERWLGQHASYAETEGYGYRPLPGLDPVVDWLRANGPETPFVGIIHGDYGFPNALFDLKAPARLAAMIDWELSTIGDPLLDLGWLLYSVPSARSQVRPPDLFWDPAYPEREELVDHYAAVTGRPVVNLTYYMVLAQFKLAMLLERHYARGLNGRLPREMGDKMGALVLDLLRSAHEMTREAATKGPSQ